MWGGGGCYSEVRRDGVVVGVVGVALLQGVSEGIRAGDTRQRNKTRHQPRAGTPLGDGAGGCCAILMLGKAQNSS